MCKCEEGGVCECGGECQEEKEGVKKINAAYIHKEERAITLMIDAFKVMVDTEDGGSIKFYFDKPLDFTLTVLAEPGNTTKHVKE